MSEDIELRWLLERKTVRRFTDKPVSRETLDQLCEAARWAPSGVNNQPWRFVTVESGQTLSEVAACTKYSKILENCTAAIAVFLDTAKLYHREKDIQSIGAALENMLLAAQALGLGGCWLGEILNRRDEVERILHVDSSLELMAVVALGYPDPAESAPRKGRVELEDLIVGRF
jgi:nitroreductase